MYSEVLLLAAIVASVSAEQAFSSQHIHKYDGHHKEVKIHDDHGHGHTHVDYLTHPKYEFENKLKDPHSHDFKEHYEIREGDVVKGHYKLHEPDGSIRHVYYHGDHHSGFLDSS